MKTQLIVSTIIFAMVCTFSCAFGQSSTVIPLSKGWKFIPGDSTSYPAPEFKDSAWVKISVDTIWEQQGFDKLDGYAWYRLHVTIPSSLKNSSSIQDGLRIHLAKINNFDQTFLNGKLIGINGKRIDAINPADSVWRKEDTGLWNLARTYVLPLDDPRIRWDQDNVIAVRVFDAGGQGGLWSGGQYLRMMQLADYLMLSGTPAPFHFTPAGQVGKNFTIRNIGTSRSIHGILRSGAEEKLTGKMLFTNSETFDLAPGESLKTQVSFKSVDAPCIVKVSCQYPDGTSADLSSTECPYLLTPAPGWKPRINGPDVYGARPDHPFLYIVPVTGARPLSYSAVGLPNGLKLDAESGIISGAVSKKGEYHVTLKASNAAGKATKKFDIVIGDEIGLTPQLGWNSWNAWGLSVDQDKVIASAHVYKEKGLIDHGWSYINIDDGWEIKGDDPRPQRDEKGRIIVNEKFPDMKALGDSLHALGLKFGIYSSPGPLTCGGYTASYQHELDDARSYAEWGIDYLKYDWCSYDQIAKDTSLAEYRKPYEVMRGALDNVNRDIFFSLCQYGMGNVWEWGAKVGGNSWRTTGDITDTWQSMSDIGFNQVANQPYAGPGHWNDPDMLVVGWVGWGPSLHPTGLTPDEQYTHISLWSLISAPMLIGCDLTKLDDFTLNLLTNDEVLAIHQDRLGKQAKPILKMDSLQIWVKDLSDGGKAVGMFNLSTVAKPCSVEMTSLGIKGAASIRDVWRQKDLKKAKEITQTVPSHGVVLLRVK